jgi:hypothetical protein
VIVPISSGNWGSNICLGRDKNLGNEKDGTRWGTEMGGLSEGRMGVRCGSYRVLGPL